MVERSLNVAWCVCVCVFVSVCVCVCVCVCADPPNRIASKLQGGPLLVISYKWSCNPYK